MDKLLYVHSRNGRIGEGTDTSPADLDAIVDALRADARGHLVLHFHGGLVSKAAGLEIAQRLSTLYGESGRALFYVWESGLLETLRNNFSELSQEPVFRQLLRKLLEYVLQRIGVDTGSRSIAPGAVDPREVARALDAFWARPARENIPFRNGEPQAAPGARSAVAASIDLDEIQADLETDADFAAALATLPDIPPGTRSALAPQGAVERRTAFSFAIAQRVANEPGARGLIAWYLVAQFVKRVLVSVLQRFDKGRDHGIYATVVEEIVRETSLGEWGKALQWNRMKQDTLDAFGPDPQRHAGTALLSRLKAAHEAGPPLRRITLIGHSTGAIYIAHWLAAADRMLPPEVKFDVVFLAPAITYALFDRTLTSHAHRIGNFRLFGMQDAVERDDQVWGDDGARAQGGDWKRFVYPSSLLYLVSGLLESGEGKDGTPVDAPDMPLLGMERFHARRDVYSDDAFPEIARVRAWFAASPNRLVWSESDGGAGLGCRSRDHGDFDNDETTLASLGAILKGW